MLVSRGRGHVSTDRREQLRRPSVSPLESIAMKIAAFDLKSPEDLEGVRAEISKYCVTIDKLKLMVNDLHERSLVSRKFGAKCAVALATQSQLTIDGKKLRALLMSNIQTDFEDKENLRHHNMNRFLNTFAFIGEVFRHVRLADGAPIAVLAAAFIEYCKVLIVGTEPEVELCVQQLAYNGKLLQQWHPQQLVALQVEIRKTSIVPGTDPRCLCWLQLASDLDRFSYGQLTSEWHELYEAQLGSEAMKNILDTLLTSEQLVVTEESNAMLMSNGLDSASQTSPLPAEHLHDGRSATKSTGDSVTPVFAPRETRTSRNPPAGSGDSARYRNQRNRDPRNDPANWLPRHEPMSEKDQGIWGSNRERRDGNWGHDDRFDRDYNPRSGEPNQSGKPNNNHEESWD